MTYPVILSVTLDRKFLSSVKNATFEVQFLIENDCSMIKNSDFLAKNTSFVYKIMTRVVLVISFDNLICREERFQQLLYSN